MSSSYPNAISADMKVGKVVHGEVWSETPARASSFLIIIKTNALKRLVWLCGNFDFATYVTGELSKK
jgi:hypothetical protein